MYAFVEGLLETHSATSVVINVNGLGLELFVPIHCPGSLPPLGQKVRLHTSFVIRENLQALYGFPKREEKELFEVLLQVSGVGPKLALALIGHLGYQELQQAVAGQDVNALSRVPGVGKKTAERLIMEVRDKLKGRFVCAQLPVNQKLLDAVSALVNLGYTQMQAHRAVSHTLEKEGPLDLAPLITSALQRLKS